MTWSLPNSEQQVQFLRNVQRLLAEVGFHATVNSFGLIRLGNIKLFEFFTLPVGEASDEISTSGVQTRRNGPVFLANKGFNFVFTFADQA